jgi:hypothetical protein
MKGSDLAVVLDGNDDGEGDTDEAAADERAAAADEPVQGS